MKNNNKGYTLIELIAVIALIAIITLLTFPNLKNLTKNNNAKEYETYQDMMVEYVKAIPNYRNNSNGYICLNKLNIKAINENTSCRGYVEISGNTLTPYLLCTNKGGEEVWKTEGTWTMKSGC